MTVFNKSDCLGDREAFRARIEGWHETAVLANTVEPGGLDGLRAALRDLARAARPVVRVVVPATDGKRIAAVYRAGEVVGREDTPEGVALTVRMEAWRARQLTEEGAGER